MPFCTSCGKQVGPSDLYCAACGTRQAASEPYTQPPRPPEDYLAGISPRTASLLCYVPWLGWIAAIVVLATPRFAAQRDVRFHAFQGLYIFVVWLLVDWVVGPVLDGDRRNRAGRVMESMMHLSLLGAWIYMLVRTSQNQLVRLPVLGELAERSLAEQR